MSRKKKARAMAKSIALALVIERGDHRFAGACGSNDKIAPIPGCALGFQRFKNPFLERVRLDFEKNHRQRRVALLLREGDGFAKDLGLFWIERNKLPAVPVGLEFDPEFFDYVRLILCRDFQIPLETLRHRGVRHVRRTDVGG